MYKLLDHSELKSQLSSYMSTLLTSFTQNASANNLRQLDAKQAAADIFNIITGRNFSHLSRGKAGKYRDAIIRHVAQDIESERPATFFYDLGPGYHASLHPGLMDLSFRIGLSELFALYQINEFSMEVSKVYSRGAQFFIIIDNLCALAANDIPTEKTLQYCADLRSLIEETGTQQNIQLLVESELFEESDYPSLELSINANDGQPLSEQETENVSRFLGRHCGMSEALARNIIYDKATEVTEKNLTSVVTGVRLTQRATEDTLGFRSFPGGDSRIQAGEIAFTHNKKGKLIPTLLTSRNVGNYDQCRFDLPAGVLDSLKHLTYARSAKL